MTANQSAHHRFLGRLGVKAGTPPSQYILYGHVGDCYYDKITQEFLTLRETLIRYLRRLRYDVIVVFNLSEDLIFPDAEMRRRYEEIVSGEPGQSTYDISGVPELPEAQGTDIARRPNSRPQVAASIFAELGRLLSQPDRGADAPVRAAVIVERLQNLVAGSLSQEERSVLDELQRWSHLVNGNVSILVADIPGTQELPATLIGRHRAGVRVIGVGPPDRREINQLFISAEQGQLERDFPEMQAVGPGPVSINESQRRELLEKLDGCDVMSVLGYLGECATRGAPELTLRELHMIVTRAPDIWPQLLSDSQRRKVERELKRRVLGQEHVVDRVMSQLLRIRQELRLQEETGRAERGLLAYWFFAGPTGVGKTEVFRVLANALPGVRSRQFNMPEYREEHSAARFFGAPPGYVGYGRGELGDFLIENPAAIVLFDEIEKAHAALWKNFLTMLEGNLTTGDGSRVDLSQAIFIFTSNAGSEALERPRPYASEAEQAEVHRRNREHVGEALRLEGAPIELMGRMTEAIITFNHMTEATVREIVHARLGGLEKALDVVCDDSVEAHFLAEYTRHSELGARRVTQQIDVTLRGELARMKERRMITPERRLVWKNAQGDTKVAARASEIVEPCHRCPTPSPEELHTERDAVPQGDVPERISRALVRVVTSDRSGGARALGGGIFVSADGHVLTTSRVVSDVGHPAIVFGLDAEPSEMALAGISRCYDLAILKPLRSFNLLVDFLVPANSGTVDIDAQILNVGLRGTENGMPPGERLRVVRGRISARREEDRVFVVNDLSLRALDRGTPVLDPEDYRLIGLLLDGAFDPKDKSFVVMSGAVQDFLRAMGVASDFETVRWNN